jgi:hypothetical protein
MKKSEYQKILTGGDLRSLGKANAVVKATQNQSDFDQLFACMLLNDRLIVMRAADAVEKITTLHPEYLSTNKKEVLSLCHQNTQKELKWHLAQLVPRLPLSVTEFKEIWSLLTTWAKDKSNSRIVRVNAVQSLADLVVQKQGSASELSLLIADLKKENIPSLNARIKSIEKQIVN